MIRGMAMLLGFQLAGEFFARLAWLPISGPICGMVALLMWLLIKGDIDADLAKVSDGVLANMALLFVPVGVGAISYADLFAGAWPVITMAILAGAGATLVTSAFVTRTLLVWTRHSHEPNSGQPAIVTPASTAPER